MTDTSTLLQKIDQLDGLTIDEKAQLKNLLNKQKEYGLVWEDKPEEVERQLLENLPVLVEVKERYIAASQPDPVEKTPNKKGISAAQLSLSLETAEDNPENQSDPGPPPSGELEDASDNGTAPHHILIEGDNLHALTALSFTHKEKIDVIYIDPPYNTGNKDFKYNDTFVDKEDSYRHSKWLSFMHKRLVLAKQLLKETGVIFISIDDNEQAQLKLLCDNIFGEANFIASPVRRRRGSQANLSLNLSTIHEYVLIFQKSTSASLNKLQANLNLADYANPDKDIRGPYVTMPCTNRGGSRYDITTPTGKVHNDEWRFKIETFESLRADNRIVFPKKGEGKPRYKLFLSGKKDSGVLANSWWDDVATNQEATVELKSVVEDSNFNNPKPIALLKRVALLSTKTNSIILDFFAGSGSTLHATMELNSEDGGSRQCILVTNNENNIAEEVCYERNKRVINGYIKPNGDKVPGLKNNHLHYYKAAFVPAQRNQINRRHIVDAATEIICIRESAFKEVGQGYSLAKESLRLFQADSGQFTLVLYYHRYMDEAVVKAIELIKQLSIENGPIKIYAFAPQGERYEEEFESVKDKIAVIPLPEAIYNAYQSSLRRINVKRYQDPGYTDTASGISSDLPEIDFNASANV